MDRRYESADIAEIWSDRSRNQIERKLWIEVMRAQRGLGMDIPEDAIDMYRDLMNSQAQADPDSEEVRGELRDIAELEKETKHDLYARLRWFNEAVGADHAHRGLTSADITENTQQIQIAESAERLSAHTEQVLRRLHRLTRAYAETPTVARTHGRPAQLTTIGKRAADWMHELMCGMIQMQTALDSYLLRGIKGAVGTNADMARTLAPGWRHAPDAERRGRADAALSLAAALDDRVSRSIAGDSSRLVSGQCYPRSTDLPIVSAASQIASACGTFANAIRLMSALGLVEENPQAHVGSSAMPHKSNPRYAERIYSLQVVARGYAGMLQELAGSQWLEGDVSTSAARRIALPGLFHTVDTILANTAWILDRMVFDWVAIEAEVDRHLPEAASGALLAAMVQKGIPRQEAHALLAHHYRQLAGEREGERLLHFTTLLEGDYSCPLTSEDLDVAFDIPTLIGAATHVAVQAADDELGELLDAADPDWPGDLV